MKAPLLVCLLLPVPATLVAHAAEPVAKIRLVTREVPLGKIDFNMAVNLDTVMLSPDGNRLAYVSERESVMDGDNEGKPYNGVSESLFFSPDSQRLAYAAWRGKKMLVVVDGTEGKEYEYIEDTVLVFSPDSRRLAVVDDEGRFQGIITPRRIFEVLLWEHDEDTARLGGFLKSSSEAKPTTLSILPSSVPTALSGHFAGQRARV